MSQEKRGLAISPGFSVGNVLLINQAKTAVQKRKINRREVVKEINRFQNAVEISKDEISALRGNQESKYKTEHIEILDFNISKWSTSLRKSNTSWIRRRCQGAFLSHVHLNINIFPKNIKNMKEK